MPSTYALRLLNTGIATNSNSLDMLVQSANFLAPLAGLRCGSSLLGRRTTSLPCCSVGGPTLSHGGLGGRWMIFTTPEPQRNKSVAIGPLDTRIHRAWPLALAPTSIGCASSRDGEDYTGSGGLRPLSFDIGSHPSHQTWACICSHLDQRICALSVSQAVNKSTASFTTEQRAARLQRPSFWQLLRAFS